MSMTRLSAVHFIRKSWSKAFNNEIVYKRVGSKCICTTTSRQFTEILYKHFTKATDPGISMGAATSEKSYPLMYQKVTESKFMFLGRKLSNSSKFYYLEPGLHSSITDIVDAMNTLIQERENRSENCITVEVSRRMQNVEIHLANERSGLAIFSTDLGHIFGSNVGNEFGVMLRGKGPHKPEFAYDIVRIHSLMLYIDLNQYSIVGDTKAPLLRCFLFLSKLKCGDIITTGNYMNYQTFSNLQFRPLLKKSFHSIHIDLRDTSGEKIPLYLSVSLVLFWCAEKLPTFTSNLKNVTRWLLQDM